MLFEFEETGSQNANIKVIGVGGGGGNVINNMIASSIRSVEFIAINTDAQALESSIANKRVQIGNALTRGLGVGSKPEIGRQAAIEDRELIADSIRGADLVFIAAGMGGGTGTGASPVVADVAKELGALTIAVVTKPFFFEGRQRTSNADFGIAELEQNVDAIIIIPNDRINLVVEKKTGLLEAFSAANNVLKHAVSGIADLILLPGFINLDFADLRTVMENAGRSVMGVGIGKGPTRALDAAKKAISNPLLEDSSIEGAKGILINITGGLDLMLDDVQEAASLIYDLAETANIKVGTAINPDISDEVKVTVIATGSQREERIVPELKLRKLSEVPDNLAKTPVKALSKNISDYTEELRKSVSSGSGMNYEVSFDIPAFLRKSSLKTLGVTNNQGI